MRTRPAMLYSDLSPQPALLAGKRRLQDVLAAIVMLTAIAVSLFAPWEMGGESWGYWYFAKVLMNGGGLVTLDRGPLYILFLAPFTLLPYPVSVLAEYVVATFTACAALYSLLRTQIGAALALLFAAASVFFVQYFLQQMEPPTQKLALACVCVALLLRLRSEERGAIAGAYALMAAAVFLRSSFLMFAAAFIACDLYRLWIAFRHDRGALIAQLRPRPAADWPLYCIVLLVAACAAFPAADVWNNVWFTTTRWFPSNDKSLAATSIIGHYNWYYIEHTYGSFDNHDFYFTHPEAYKGALTVSGMFLANPGLFIETLLHNVFKFFPAANLNFPLPISDSPVVWAMAVVLFLLTTLAAFFSSSNIYVRAFVVGGVLAVLATVVSLPKARYMFPLLPVVALGAAQIGIRLQEWIVGAGDDQTALQRRLGRCLLLLLTGAAFFLIGQGLRGLGRVLVCAGMLLPILFLLVSRIGSATWRTRLLAHTRLAIVWGVALSFSFNALMAYAASLRAMSAQVKSGQFHLLAASGPTSMHRAYSELRQALRGCQGVMSLEHLYVATFLLESPARAYDVWEIPPFPPADDSSYRGLSPARIDCVLESTDLTTAIGMGTNVRLRYKYYLQPYISELIVNGATVIAIPHYGRLIKAKAIDG